MSLREYQMNHYLHVKKILIDYGSVLDSSDSGTGKTYVAANICKECGFRPIIICPERYRSHWEDVMEIFGVEILDIGSDRWSNLPEDTVFVFGQIHELLDNPSIMAAKETGCKILMTSSCVYRNIEKFSIVSSLLGLEGYSDNIQKFIRTNLDKQVGDYFRENLSKRCPRMVIKKSIKVVPCIYDPGSETKKNIADAYSSLVYLKKRRKSVKHIRERIEREKINLIIAEVTNFLKEGKKIVTVTVNFKSTEEILKDFFQGNSKVKVYTVNSEYLPEYYVCRSSQANVISPHWNIRTMVREMKKNYSIVYKIIYSKGCIEERICKILEDKLRNYFL